MTFTNALYSLFIGPLELFFEIIFVIANRLIDNLGLSIIVLSLVMNFLVLPLYKRADAIQDEQRDTEKRLRKWTNHIKKTFTGDERFMMLQTYYRQNNYKPWSILKGSISLLLEIPFFIAAYNFLSNAGVFNGYSFGPFTDFGAPDGLIRIGSLSINLLPILMTVINIVSSIIYTKGLPVSSKVQLYGMAGLFLILLYDSPACLVFYWTLNNLFSLIKNFITKLKNKKLFIGISSSFIGLSLIIFEILHPFNTLKKNLFITAFILISQIPLTIYFLKKYKKFINPLENYRTSKGIFFLSISILTLLIGILIPSAVIKASPEEFINKFNFSSPLVYIINSTLLSIGTFVIWFSIFYKLANDLGKKIIEIIVSMLSIMGIANYIIFGKNEGSLTSMLKLGSGFQFDNKILIINLIIVLTIFIIIYLFYMKNQSILKYSLNVVSICLIIMSAINCFTIFKVSRDKIDNLKSTPTKIANIPISKNGKNILIFMMDRAINSYIPYIFNEKPEVAKQFDGFTYYPNTISFGGHTNFGLPPVFGGYEYTPKEMNKRVNKSLCDKHNEAMKVLPVLFNQNNFETTVCDPTYAGYDWIPDLTIYDDYPTINTYETMDGSLVGNIKENEENKSKILKRNFYLYGILKASPLFLQATIYNSGNYNGINTINQVSDGIYKATGTHPDFEVSYNVLKNLSKITNLRDDNKNTFMMMCNDTTHSPCILQVPEYIPIQNVDNTEYEKTHADRFIVDGKQMIMNYSGVIHYHVNVAAMIQLGNYFDFLRKNNVYDNTRIIIVADHGNNNKQFEDLLLGDGPYDDIMLYNPLLMVKDFNATEFSIDTNFMTNADVPTLATNGLIENPINPFTNKTINNNEKKLHDQYIINSHEYHIDINNGNKYLPSPWYAVHDNMLDKKNWTSLPIE